MNEPKRKGYLIRCGIIVALVLGFWLYMLTFYGKYIAALSSMDDEGEAVAENYEILLRRGIFVTRIALVVMVAGLLIYVTVKFIRARRARR